MSIFVKQSDNSIQIIEGHNSLKKLSDIITYYAVLPQNKECYSRVEIIKTPIYENVKHSGLLDDYIYIGDKYTINRIDD